MSSLRRNKLRLSAWLMLLSQVVLLFFMGTWLHAQYGDERERLYKDLVSELATAEEAIIDSVIQRQFAKTMTTQGVSATAITDSVIEMEIPGNIDSLFIPPPRPHPLANKQFFKIEPQGGAGRTIDMHIIDRRNDSISPAAIKGVRMLIRNISSLAPEQHDRLFGVDSTLLRDKFKKRLELNKYPFGLQWAPAGAADRNNSRFIVLSVNNIAASSDFVITGIRMYLLRGILPQMGFSLVLLLLTGLAFGLSYANLRRQIRLGLQKDDFISNMSHELKTPVATAKVALEALRNFNALNDPKRTQDYLQMASWEIDRLDVLIARVLNAMQLENGQIVLQKEHFDLLAMTQELVQALQPRAAGLDTKITLSASSAHMPVHGDGLHLQGAVYNLLDNALKYGGDAIQVGFHRTGTEIVLTVADNGRGIPAEYGRKIFEKFFRIPQGDVHDVKGYGLGLNYTRYIAEAHGGQIAQHNGEDGGAVFTIVLPETTER